MTENDSWTYSHSSLWDVGELRPHIDDFADELKAIGYEHLTILGYTGSIVHFAHWVCRKGLTIKDLNVDSVSRFARHRCRCPARGRGERVSQKYARRVKRFVAYLAIRGVVSSRPEAPKAQPSEFFDWLIHHRGTSVRTAERYESDIAKLLSKGTGIHGTDTTAADVRALVLGQARVRSLPYLKCLLTALRAYLRFLASKGRCRPGLDRAVPLIAQWRLSALPKYLPERDVERVIDSCSAATEVGLRDRAILLLLARLGLRAGDIVALSLNDIDWDAATLRVCGKGRQEVCLPLPQDAGDAILTYLRRVRPQVCIDNLFLCIQAPVRSLQSASTVSAIVSAALRRADVVDPPSRGTNLLRHSAATAMLRGGASLDAVSSMLRHRSLNMTGHYAKVDVRMLRDVAQPWPEGVPC